MRFSDAICLLPVLCVPGRGWLSRKREALISSRRAGGVGGGGRAGGGAGRRRAVSPAPSALSPCRARAAPRAGSAPSATQRALAGQLACPVAFPLSPSKARGRTREASACRSARLSPRRAAGRRAPPSARPRARSLKPWRCSGVARTVRSGVQGGDAGRERERVARQPVLDVVCRFVEPACRTHLFARRGRGTRPVEGGHYRGAESVRESRMGLRRVAMAPLAGGVVVPRLLLRPARGAFLPPPPPPPE